jgi:hypothetical protein
MRSTAFVLDFLNVYLVGEYVFIQLKSKGLVTTMDLESFGDHISKRVPCEWRDSIAFLRLHKMLDIGRNGIKGQVIHPFIEPSMFCKLDMREFGVKPDDVFHSIQEEPQEYALV